MGYPESPFSLRVHRVKAKTSGDHVTLWSCVPKDSDVRIPELLRNAGLGEQLPWPEGSAQTSQSPGNLDQEADHGLPAFSKSSFQSMSLGQYAWE